MRTYVIAECGSCHDMSLDKALALVEEAAKAGASAAKFQYWSDGALLARRRHAPELTDVYTRYALPANWLPVLETHCTEHKIQFACTSYLPQDVYAVAEHAHVLKVSSFEAQAPDLLAAHIPFGIAGRRIIVSLGMGSRHTSEICKYLRQPVRAAQQNIDWRPQLLLCLSAYPAAADELNLWRLSLHDYDGFSDHLPPWFEQSGAYAVMAGARVLERHLRLDDTAPDNPDFRHAMPPVAFARYVKNVQIAETMLGTKDTVFAGPAPCEEPMLRYRVGAPVQEGAC